MGITVNSSMKLEKDVLISSMEALGKFITSPYPYFGLISLIEFLGFQNTLLHNPLSMKVILVFSIFSTVMFFSLYLVYRLISEVGPAEMLPGSELIELNKVRRD